MSPFTDSEASIRQHAANTLIAGLNHVQLRALLLKLIELEPGLVETIKSQVSLLASAPSSAGSSPATQAQAARPPVDSKAVRREVRSLLGYSGGGRRSWRGYEPVGVAVSAVSEVVDQAKRLIEAGDGREALVMLGVLTEEFLPVWEGLDDSDGGSSL